MVFGCSDRIVLLLAPFLFVQHKYRLCQKHYSVFCYGDDKSKYPNKNNAIDPSRP